jgi:N-acetylneuraminic acid mutarotase
MKRIQLISKRNIAAIMLLCVATSADAKWTQLAEFSTFGQGRWGAMSFVVDNKIYAGGGYVGNFSNVNDWQSYDPATKQWKFLNSMPGTNFNRTEGVAFAVNGKGYLGLGAQDYNGFNPSPTYLVDLWEYNAATDQWTKKKDLPDSGRSDASFFTINNKAYVVGGSTGSFGRSADTWEYDPATDKWTEKKPFPGNMEGGTGFSINGKGYIVGGTISNTTSNKLYEFNPSGNTWTEKAPFPEAELFGAVAFVIDNKAYVGLGAQDAYDATNSKYFQYFYTYDPAKNSWSYAPGFELNADGRMFAIAEVVNGKAYIGAGWRLNGGSTQVFFRDFHEADPAVAAGINTLSTTVIKLYPNPTKDILHIDGNVIGGQYTLYDITGKVVKNGIIGAGHINISDMIPGLYTITISTDEGVINHTVVKQ